MTASRIKDAKEAYELAIAKAGDNANLSAKAQFGLGLCAEELADYDDAQNIYKKVIDSEAYSATVFPTQAQARLNNIEENRAEFVFVDAPKPEPVPEILPGVLGGTPEPVEITVEPEEKKPAETVIE